MTVSQRTRTNPSHHSDLGAGAVSPRWLQHHHGTDRCARVGRHHVCRRCLVLYPTVVITAVLATVVAGSTFVVNGPAGPSIRGYAVVPGIWLLVAPMAIDWVLEHAGRTEYSARRQSVVSVAAGLGGGLALAVHVQDPFNVRATLPIAAVTVTCLVSTLLTAGRSTGTRGDGAVSRPGLTTRSLHVASRATDQPDWLEQHEADEAERLARLTRLLDRQDS